MYIVVEGGHMPFKPLDAYSVDEVVEVLNITRKTFQHWVANDPDFKTYKIGRHRFMDHEDLTNWIEAKRATKDKQ
jgi:hypothetical protein